MKLLSKLFLFTVMMVVLQAGSVYAQLAGANLIAHGVLALAGGGNREKKQEKIIEKSETQEKISGANVTVLRVKDADIKSKAKAHIIALQNRLSVYHAQYKNNEPLSVPKNDSDVLAIQDMDENWPTEDYTSEIRAYKKYAVQQKQKMPPAPADGLHTTPASSVKKDTTGVK